MQRRHIVVSLMVGLAALLPPPGVATSSGCSGHSHLGGRELGTKANRASGGPFGTGTRRPVIEFVNSCWSIRILL